MKRAFGIGAVTVLILLATLLHSSHIKHFLWTHPWWHSFFVALPAVILAVLDLLHRREANKLSSDANALHAEANTLQLRNDTLVAELDAERNKQLQQIARNTERSITRADRNANILRRHLGEKVAVSEEHGTWPGTPQIVEVGDDYIFTLFTPHGQSSSSAHLIQAHCEDVEVVEAPQGACPLHLKVLKRYGPVVELGEITKWEDRSQPSATPTFAKGRVAYYAMYAKP
ncbi:MAG TPA: hypothetical protein VNJ12_05620, partial [Candidatus Dormibacteraeota bacterium]|nr:hypothetical protein [Candidatus Dormibacteraeota bacterium]